jgi:hypothetical protein
MCLLVVMDSKIVLIAAELVYRLANLVAFRRFLGMFAFGSRS